MRYSQEAKVGMVIFVAVIVLIVGLIYFGDYHIRSAEYTIHVRMKNVQGVGKDDPVTIAGFKVGKVKDMHLEDDNTVTVDMRIKREFQIPKDSKVYIGSISLLGEKYVGITLGVVQKMLQDGDTIDGSYQKGTGKLTSFLDPMLSDISDLLKKLDSLLDKGSEERIKGSLENIRDLTADLENLISNDMHELGPILRDVKSVSGDIKDVTGSQKQKIEAMIDNFEEGSRSLKNASSYLERISKSMESITGKLDKGHGTLGRMLEDEQLYEDLDILVQDLSTLIKEFREDPQKYTQIKVKLF